MKRILSIIVVSGGAASAMAGPTFHAVDKNQTSTVLHGGDRELLRMGFAGSGTVMHNEDFIRWTDGRFTNNIGTYGWNQQVSRDMNSSGNIFTGNPDRADGSSGFPTEGANTGSIGEVFGPYNGYKNLSWIIDGEDTGAWTLDLKFAPGQHLDSDNSSSTVELAILERGGNSDLKIYGIRADGSLTGSIMMNRGSTAQAGWTLDTLEIGGAQQVYGVGVSLDSSWDGLIGFRFKAENGMNGPDLVAVGAGSTVPTPGSLALLGLGGLVAGRRKR